MYRFVVLVCAVAFASGEPEANPSGVIAAAVAAPAVAPAIITARSSQYIARTYNALAAPVVAPAAPVVAPAVPVIAPAAKIVAPIAPAFAPAAPVASVVSAPLFAPSAAYLAPAAAPFVNYATPAYTSAYALPAYSPVVAPAAVAAPISSYYSAPIIAAPTALAAAPLAAAPLAAAPVATVAAPALRAFPAGAPTTLPGTAPVNTVAPEVTEARAIPGRPERNQQPQANNDDSVSIFAARSAQNQPGSFRILAASSASGNAASRATNPAQDQEQFDRNQPQPQSNQGNNGPNFPGAFSVAQAGGFPQFENIPERPNIQRENIPQGRRFQDPPPRDQQSPAAPRNNPPSEPSQTSPYYSNAVAVSSYLPAKL